LSPVAESLLGNNELPLSGDPYGRPKEPAVFSFFLAQHGLTSLAIQSSPLDKDQKDSSLLSTPSATRSPRNIRPFETVSPYFFVASRVLTASCIYDSVTNLPLLSTQLNGDLKDTSRESRLRLCIIHLPQNSYRFRIRDLFQA
jgi:hypothetical protein